MGKTTRTDAIYGVHYLIDAATGRSYPIVRGGDGDDGPTTPTLVELVEQAENAETLAGLDFGQLLELHTALSAAYAEARAAVETDEQVDALTSVVDAIRLVADRGAVVWGELETAAQTEQERAEARAARLAALDNDVAATLSTDDGGDDDGDQGGDQGAAGDAAGAAGGDGGQGDGGDTGAGGDGSGDDAGDQGAADGGGQQAPSRQASAANLAVLANMQRSAQGNRPQAPAQGGNDLARRIVASNTLADLPGGHVFRDTDELGRTIATLASDLVVESPTLRKHYVGRVPINAEAPHLVMARDFAGQPDADLIGMAVERTRTARLERAQALAGETGRRRVASGGICAPAQPDYTITVVGDRGTPFVDSLPTVVAERPLSYFPFIELSLNEAAGSRPGARPNKGIGTVTAAQDAAGYGGTNFAGVTTAVPNGGHAYKDCVRIDCPSPVTSVPEATFKCTTVGNFTALTFKEYVAAFDTVVGSYFDIYRDERSIAKVVAAAKKVHGSTPTWGTARDILTKLRRLAAHVRSDRHAPNMAFDVRVPAFAAEMVANDIAVSYANGSDNLRISPAQALAILAAEEGIMLDTYAVSAGTTLGGSPTVLPQQAAGELNDWPEEIRLLIWAEGEVFRTSYGELAFGLRETGMQTNDVSAFEETFEQTSTRGTDIYTLDLAVCENGAQGAAIAVTCTEE